MMMMIAASLAAAAPAAPAQPMGAHVQHMPMAGHEQHGQMADMKDCCCKEVMDKMHGEHAGHEDHVHE